MFHHIMLQFIIFSLKTKLSK